MFNSQYRAIIFDMDGTITRPVLDFRQIRDEIGLPDGDIAQTIAALNSSEQERAWAIIRRHELEAESLQELQDGAGTLLERCRSEGVFLGLITRNLQRSVDALCERFGLKFDCVITREFPHIKPHPAPILHMLNLWNVAPDQTLMVGDYIHDIECGKAAGTETCFFLNPGFRDYGSHADYSVSSMLELSNIIWRNDNCDLIRRTYQINGTVQGVGFRPTIYRLAREACLGGWIQNRSGSVVLALEGEVLSIDAFISNLSSNLPDNANVTSIEKLGEENVEAPPGPFHIMESGFDAQSNVTIPADLAMCPECRSEILDSSDRRHLYPFTTCTNCGPRYTVVNAMPYDRSRTTLNEFPLCDDCAKEYSDPLNRRFHAESTACPACGPHVSYEQEGNTVIQNNEAIAAARKALADGKIVALRGIGGFHLAIDATNPDAVAELRRRKHRPDKPFAVMVRNIDAARKICHVSKAAAALLQSPEAPIVIMDISEDTSAESLLAYQDISPDTRTLGLMLPTSPLHLLLHEGVSSDGPPPFDFLVMTSGNQSSEPICIDNDEASIRLRGIADAFLMHNREINLRNDDSLAIEQSTGLQIWRRGRGYAPNPIPTPAPLKRRVLAMGAELKNAVAFGDSDSVTLSPHIGDLTTPEANDAHERVARELPDFLSRTPDCIAVDLHPDMHCTLHGVKLSKKLDLPCLAVQHHHAHAMACLAENGRTSGLVLAFDGTGLGSDGTIWGAELLHVDGPQYERLATFAPVPLPGGDAAVHEPMRQVVARWYAGGITPSSEIMDRCKLSEDQLDIWTQQCSKNINTTLSHGAGRVFDAISAIIGFAPQRCTYEGQAPIRLEAAAREGSRNSDLPFDVNRDNSLLIIDWSPAFHILTSNHKSHWSNPDTALAAHHAIANAALTMIKHGLETSGLREVGLTGGVFMNRLLCNLLIPMLNNDGITVLTHSQTPPNDGCIAFGQAVIAGLQE